MWGRLARCFGYMPVDVERPRTPSQQRLHPLHPLSSQSNGQMHLSSSDQLHLLAPSNAASSSSAQEAASTSGGSVSVSVSVRGLSATQQIVQRVGSTGPWERYPPALVFPEGAFSHQDFLSFIPCFTRSRSPLQSSLLPCR